MTYHVDIQNVSTQEIALTLEQLTSIVELVLQEHVHSAELTLRIVDPQEMIDLNNTYRKENKPTNVLAFPCFLPQEIELECPLLGDIIICPQVLVEESKELAKNLAEHWALIVIHGVLHLLGYDHIKEEEAQIMQSKESSILHKLGYADPYTLEGNELE